MIKAAQSFDKINQDWKGFGVRFLKGTVCLKINIVKNFLYLLAAHILIIAPSFRFVLKKVHFLIFPISVPFHAFSHRIRQGGVHRIHIPVDSYGDVCLPYA